MTISPVGKNGTGPVYKTPHFERPLQCTLSRAYQKAPKNVSKISYVLKELLTSIGNGKFKPFFDQQEIDLLFEKEILKFYAAGRYYNQQTLDALEKWGDLLNNLAWPFIANLYLLKRYGKEDAERTTAVEGIRTSLRRLKIIEDWIYYHPEAQEAVSLLLEEGKLLTCEGLRLKTDYQKPERPQTITTLLVVDDEQHILTIYKQIINNKFPSLRVLLVRPDQPIRKQVLALTLVNKIDMVIMDGQMPETSGEALTKELRNRGFAGYIAANSSMPERQELMSQAGADFKIEGKSVSNILKMFEDKEKG